MLGVNGVTLPAALAVPLGGAAQYFEQLGIAFTLGGGAQLVKMYAWIAVLMAIALFLPNTQELMGNYRPALGYRATPETFRLRWTPNRGWAIAAAFIAGVGMLSLYRRSEFIYFQF
jgi:alginate O-acetyltransferase complex protein AlgI